MNLRDVGFTPFKQIYKLDSKMLGNGDSFVHVTHLATKLEYLLIVHIT